jgi:hypothetical protein
MQINVHPVGLSIEQVRNQEQFTETAVEDRKTRHK